jgi:hypothetical protein
MANVVVRAAQWVWKNRDGIVWGSVAGLMLALTMASNNAVTNATKTYKHDCLAAYYGVQLRDMRILDFYDHQYNDAAPRLRQTGGRHVTHVRCRNLDFAKVASRWVCEAAAPSGVQIDRPVLHLAEGCTRNGTAIDLPAPIHLARTYVSFSTYDDVPPTPVCPSYVSVEWAAPTCPEPDEGLCSKLDSIYVEFGQQAREPGERMAHTCGTVELGSCASLPDTVHLIYSALLYRYGFPTVVCAVGAAAWAAVLWVATSFFVWLSICVFFILIAGAILLIALELVITTTSRGWNAGYLYTKQPAAKKPCGLYMSRMCIECDFPLGNTHQEAAFIEALAALLAVSFYARNKTHVVTPAPPIPIAGPCSPATPVVDPPAPAADADPPPPAAPADPRPPAAPACCVAAPAQ